MEVVWLAHSSSPVMHNPTGRVSDRIWATKCGAPIQSYVLSTYGMPVVKESGLVIKRDLLNPTKVRECGNCFRRK